VTSVKRILLQYPLATVSAESKRLLSPRFRSFATQELPLSSTESTATAVDQVCSSRACHQEPLQTLSFVDCTPLPTLSFVWQIKPTIPSLLLYNQSLQLHPSFPSLLPTATPYTTFGNSDLAVTPQDCLLMQPRTVDCPYIYPYSIPKYFLPWQLLLPTPSPLIGPEPSSVAST